MLAVKGALEGGKAALRPPLATLALDELAAFLRLAGRAGALQPALLPLLTFICRRASCPATLHPAWWHRVHPCWICGLTALRLAGRAAVLHQARLRLLAFMWRCAPCMGACRSFHPGTSVTLDTLVGLGDLPALPDVGC